MGAMVDVEMMVTNVEMVWSAMSDEEIALAVMMIEGRMTDVEMTMGSMRTDEMLTGLMMSKGMALSVLI